jgi:hypothetical protein
MVHKQSNYHLFILVNDSYFIEKILKLKFLRDHIQLHTMKNLATISDLKV